MLSSKTKSHSVLCVARDFRSPDEIEEDDKQDSDYEPEPLIQAKEPKKKRGRGNLPFRHLIYAGLPS